MAITESNCYTKNYRRATDKMIANYVFELTYLCVMTKML